MSDPGSERESPECVDPIALDDPDGDEKPEEFNDQPFFPASPAEEPPQTFADHGEQAQETPGTQNEAQEAAPEAEGMENPQPENAETTEGQQENPEPANAETTGDEAA